jgi:hypothetical protein
LATREADDSDVDEDANDVCGVTRCAGEKNKQKPSPTSWLVLGNGSAGYVSPDVLQVFCDLGEGKDVRRRSCGRGKGGEGGRNRAALITPQEHGVGSKGWRG